MSQILAIGGGKGGTGKSFLAANLGIALADMGKKVVLVDLDLTGGANLHTLLGIPFPERTLDDLFYGQVDSLEGLLLDTSIKGLKFVSGLIRGISDKARFRVKRRLEKVLEELKADYVVLDLGAGISSVILDFFLLARKKFIVLTPEGTAVENVYRFMRGAYFRYLRSLVSPPLRDIVDKAYEGKEVSLRTPADLLRVLESMEPSAVERCKEGLFGFGLCVVLNQVRRNEEKQMGYSFKVVCKKYFEIEPLYLGYIPFDPKVPFAVNKGRPFLREYPYTEVSQCIRGIALRLMAGKEATI